MKRILTLALAALFVVAFAIPAFAAPKIELVGATIETYAGWDASGWWGGEDVPVMSTLTYKFSADNFVFNAILDPMHALTTPLADDTTYLFGGFVNGYDFSLTLPFMALTGSYYDYNVYQHTGRYLKLASDAKFQELAGFNWSVYGNDDNVVGLFDSVHAKIGVPVDAFTGTLEYVHDVTTVHDSGYLTAQYNFTDLLYAKATVGKDFTNVTDDFGFYAEVGAPIVDGVKVIAKGYYTMDNLNWNVDKGSNWKPNVFAANASFRYNNEATNAEFYAGYASQNDFTTAGKISARAEYVNNGTLFAVAGDWQPEYAEGDWNTYYDWVRGNSGNDFSVEADGYYELDGTYAANVRGMFAPDVVPVVFTAKANYTSEFGLYDTDENPLTVPVQIDYVKYSIDGYLGVRINPDIHLALHGNYLNNNLAVDFLTLTDIVPVNDFTLDSALVYNRDSVTASVTAFDLTDFTVNGGVELYVGISF